MWSLRECDKRKGRLNGTKRCYTCFASDRWVIQPKFSELMKLNFSAEEKFNFSQIEGLFVD